MKIILQIDITKYQMGENIKINDQKIIGLKIDSYKNSKYIEKDELEQLDLSDNAFNTRKLKGIIEELGRNDFKNKY